jgi:hypothetical protein
MTLIVVLANRQHGVLVSEAAVKLEDVSSLCELLVREAPAQALIGKAVNEIREASASFRTRKTVGQQCTSLVIPANRDETVDAEYHSAKPARTHFIPSLVNARSADTAQYIIAEPGFELRDAQGKPGILSVPRVGRNQPCPCGSGRKYKNWHGAERRGEPGEGRTFGFG